MTVAKAEEEHAYAPSERRLERERYRRARARRATAIAALSTLVVAVVLYLVVVNAPGWQRTKETFFDGHYAREALPKVLEGLWLNLRLLVVCGAAVLVLGMLIAIARTLRGPVFFPLRVLAAAYTDFFRGLPLIINLMIVVLGVPALRLQGVTVDPVLLGGTALTLTYSAYVAEVFRAGIESVHPSQRAAARSLGLSNRQALRHVVLPQAVRRQVPPLLNDLVSLQKDTGLVSIGGAIDAVRAADIIVGRSLNYTPYIVAGLLFVALTIPMTRFTDWVTARMDRQRSQGGTA
ncbi:amino acid ABC transporter permease [Streptomyces acidiscabies]|uniref:Amino acid ABC transporter permease n=1 Tax=Streptomyces acidiscabies TaxID=42234 RepID=A0AAP6B5Z3_9ACTN|nr:amino acid ABC transporter permease [Streptomyces acidiscabies]MDX2958798.1 amino acid ABC transporter permease [Streptomyces acidiscabies]MDX3018235.1 amino acid ABC transporter permease [Streptomyces acidiscabies]MDX3791633.1 amino acid ABC transporter permease [Streptomyces acidiscabies]GAQ56464.1 putative glutamine ABC transporter permease protein [Streptomyces acidiscabies]GAV41102.1 putative glutamine ABC transporter permease protein [Streptomyces acidiscabies]